MIKTGFIKILFLAFIVRLVLLPLSFHSDLNTNAIWGIYAKEFGFNGYYDWLNFGNYARPEYPPVSTLIFWSVRLTWQFLFSIFWWLNVHFPVFPSKFIPWFESSGYLLLFKIPGLLSDLGIGYLIFKFTRKIKGERFGMKMSIFYLFNPAVIYLSASWGQTESFIGLFGLLSVLFLLKRNVVHSTVAFFISIMTKATMIVSLPILLLKAIKEKIDAKSTFLSVGTILMSTYLMGSLFSDDKPVIWLIKNYKEKFIVGPYNLPFINLNAFNFWGLVVGLERISDKTLFMGVALSTWGWIVAIVFFLIVLYKFWKGQNIFFALVVIFLAAFTFLPRMHERYLYPIFVFFPFLVAKLPGLKKYFYALSVLWMLNLYHWWWFPKIEILVNFLDLEIIERTLSFFVVFCFFAMLKEYLNYGKN